MTEKLFLEDSYKAEFDATITAIGEQGLQFNQTIFYATSGGQPGDTGRLDVANQNVAVTGVIKGAGFDDIWHQVGSDLSSFKVGDTVRGTIDWDTRHRHMRMHTCLHLVCSLIEGDVTGGSVGADKGRLDFNISADAVDKDELTARLNDLIAQDHPITTRWISDEELAANPQMIRTMSVKPPMGGGRIRLVQIGADDNIVDLQPCGGTHVKRTGEIGRVQIMKIENKGKQNRRISVSFSE